MKNYKKPMAMAMYCTSYKCYCWDLPSIKNVIWYDVCVGAYNFVRIKCKYRASNTSREKENNKPAHSVILINFELWMNFILMCREHKFICSLLFSGGCLVFVMFVICFAKKMQFFFFLVHIHQTNYENVPFFIRSSNKKCIEENIV